MVAGARRMGAGRRPHRSWWAGALSNQEIAERLFMSPATAKTHVVRAMAKLHAGDRAQLVVIAYETGLVTPGA